MLAPGDHRPTWLGGVIQIMITRACNLSCTGCTQGSNLAGKPVVMSLDHFEQAVASLKDYYGVVGIFGGNPCLHPNFLEICEISRKYIPKRRLGLWSNNLMGYGKVCRETFNPEYSNLNVHCDREAFSEMVRDWPESNPKGLHDSRHSPPYVALDDLSDLSEQEKKQLIENCDINKYWSAMICSVHGNLRAYFCELAGAQAMLHSDYPDLGLPVTDDWWKLPIEKFNKQINFHCFKCGVPLRAKGDLAIGGKYEYVSKEHLPIFQLKRANGKEILVIKNKADLTGFVERATDYCENGYIS